MAGASFFREIDFAKNFTQITPHTPEKVIFNVLII